MAKCAKRRRFYPAQATPPAAGRTVGHEHGEARAAGHARDLLLDPHAAAAIQRQDAKQARGICFSSNCDIFSGTRLEWSAKGSEH